MLLRPLEVKCNFVAIIISKSCSFKDTETEEKEKIHPDKKRPLYYMQTRKSFF
jgi:hypothetical protein